jgi:hypothetical protein
MIPDAYYESIYKIDYDKLKRIGIKNIFFDIDNTIIPYKEYEINEETKKLFKNLMKDFNIFLFSNSPRKRVLRIAKELDVDAYYFSMKPLKRNYKKILNMFNRNNCVFIGDQLLTDVLGAKRNKLKVILVNRLKEYEPFTTRFWRSIENMYLKKYEKKKIFKTNEFYDRLKIV